MIVQLAGWRFIDYSHCYVVEDIGYRIVGMKIYSL